MMYRYSDPARTYHNVDHIEYVLHEFDAAIEATGGGITKNPDATEFALWLHDVIYTPGSRTNEEESAWFAKIMAYELGLPTAFGKRVGDLVEATKHEHTPTDPDTMLVVDCDLASLGASPAVFNDLDAKICHEYESVYTQDALRAQRKEFMSRFLDRRIFNTEHFHKNYETLAKKNIARLVRQLS